MSSNNIFPPVTGWKATLRTLKWYSRSVGVVPRTHAESHPKWWHISLKVDPDGLATDRIPLPGGGNFWLKLDLKGHEVVLETTSGLSSRVSMQERLSSTDFGDRILGAVADLGISGDYLREKFENEDPRQYDPADAERYRNVIVHVDHLLKQHRSALSGERSPVQLWPHGFDLAFEWFGTRTVEYEENGEVTRYPSQLNFGFSPGDPNHPKPYYYSNPWPFEKEKLVGHSLPSGARWFTEGWEGTILPYEELVGDPQADERLLDYFKRVYTISSPMLM